MIPNKALNFVYVIVHISTVAVSSQHLIQVRLAQVDACHCVPTGPLLRASDGVGLRLPVGHVHTRRTMSGHVLTMETALLWTSTFGLGHAQPWHCVANAGESVHHLSARIGLLIGFLWGY